MIADPSPSIEIDRLHELYARTGDDRLRRQLIAHYDGLAVRLGRTFSTRRESEEDLVQVARLALIHAVDRFDPARERPFIPFARKTILGELKRHLRDRTWRIRPSRRLQEAYLLVIRTIDDLTHELRRSPTVPEIADRAGLREDEVLEAVDLFRATPMSLDEPGDGDVPMEVGQADTGFALVEERLLLRSVLGSLTEHEQRILRLRFDEELSQAEIGALVGRSQMYVSRVLARILGRIRPRMVEGRAVISAPGIRTHREALNEMIRNTP